MIYWVKTPSIARTKIPHPVPAKNQVLNIFKTFQTAGTMRTVGGGRGQKAER